jgi:hypothetical protein
MLSGNLARNTVRVTPANGFAVSVERRRLWTTDESDPLRFETANPTAPPIRVDVKPKPPQSGNDELGWPISARKETPRQVTQPQTDRTASVATATTTAPTATQSAASTQWLAPLSATTAWCVAVVLLGVLFVRWPRATWPEQFALVGGLFGAAVAGGWWIAVPAWIAARGVWLAEPITSPRPPPATPGR